MTACTLALIAGLPRHALTATRIGALGCAYGNLPGFLASVRALRQAGAQAVVFCGDALGFCGHAPAMIDALRHECAAVIAGNHDRAATRGQNGCGCGHADPDDEAASDAASRGQADGLDGDALAWLASLPEALVLDTPAGGVLLCHGSPDRINEFLYASRLDEARATDWLAESQCRALLCSHSGLPWTLPVAGGVVVNVGSCGRPDHDGDPAVHAALIDLDGAHGDPRILRVPYDHLAWCAALRAEGVASALVAQLERGRWAHGSGALPPAEARARAATP